MCKIIICRCFLCYTGKCCRIWTRKWLVVTDQYVCYLRDSTHDEAHDIMLIDTGFNLLFGEEATGLDLGIIIENRSRKLLIEASDFLDWTNWISSILSAQKNSPWSPDTMRKYDSFAPTRSQCYVKHFIDG